MQSSTWSSYKHNNTAKFLIACTPNGVICHGNFGPLKFLVPDRYFQKSLIRLEQFYLKKMVRVQKKRFGDLFQASTWLIFSLRVMAEIDETVGDCSDCDDFVEEACAYLVSKEYPECVCETKKRVIRRKAAKLTISVEGELLYKHKQGKEVSSVLLMLPLSFLIFLVMTCMYVCVQ